MKNVINPVGRAIVLSLVCVLSAMLGASAYAVPVTFADYDNFIENFNTGTGLNALFEDQSAPDVFVINNPNTANGTISSTTAPGPQAETTSARQLLTSTWRLVSNLQ